MGVQEMYVRKANSNLVQVLAARNMEVTNAEMALLLESTMSMIFYRLGNGESLRWYIGMLYSLEAILKEIMKAETLRATKVFYFYPPRLIPYVHKDNFNREEYIFALKELNILLLASHGKLPAEIYAEVIWLLLAGLSLRALNFNSCIYYP